MALVGIIYRVEVVGMNPFQLVLAGTVHIAAVFFAEVPTGVVADAYSRKLSMLIGFTLLGIGLIFEGSIPQLWAVLVGQLIWGIGRTFISGAWSAWLAGEIGEDILQNVMIRGEQIGRTIAIIGTITAMILGSINLGLTIQLIGSGFLLLALTLLIIMPETDFVPAAADERETWGKLKQTFQAGTKYVRASNFLMLIFIIELCYGFTDPGIHRLSEAHLLEDFIWPTYRNWQPVTWLGLISITNSLLTIGVTEWLRRNVAEQDAQRVMQVMRVINLVYIVGIVAFAFANSFALGVLMFILMSQASRANFALYDPWLTKQIAPEVRATVLSMWGQMNALGQMLGGPVIGAIAVATSLPIGYATIALLLLPVPILLTVLLRQNQV